MFEELPAGVRSVCRCSSEHVYFRGEKVIGVWKSDVSGEECYVDALTGSGVFVPEVVSRFRSAAARWRMFHVSPTPCEVV